MLAFQTGLTTFLHILRHQNRGRAALTPPSVAAALTMNPADLRKILTRVNPQKAMGPDYIPGRVVRVCTDELADVLTDIINHSLSQTIIPRCFKESVIVPVAKKKKACPNDYQPVALTPIMMKCFEQLIKPHVMASLPVSFNQFQFARCPTRSTEDAL